MTQEQVSEKVCAEVAGHYDCVRNSIHGYLNTHQPRGEDRGKLRVVLPISVARMKTINKKVEETLQRTILSLMNADTPGRWFNEFAVCVGIEGGVRGAVDLLHTSVNGEVWDFIELKDWDAKDEPEEVARQAQGYFFALSPLVERLVTPYDRRRPKSVRLWIMAPQAHFNRYGGVSIYEARIKDIAKALAPLLKTRTEMLKVSFCSTPLVLDESIGKKDFIGMFDKGRMELLIEKGKPAATPLKILTPEKIETLRSWVKKAVSPVEE